MWGQAKTVTRYLERCGAFGPWTNGIATRLLGWSESHRVIGRNRIPVLDALITIDRMAKCVAAICGIFRSTSTSEEKKDDRSDAKFAVGLEVEELQRPSLRYEL